MDVESELSVLIRAKYPILYIVSYEERRVDDAIARVSKGLNRTMYTWSITQGMAPAIPGSTSGRSSNLPAELEVLALIREATDYGVFVVKDFHPYLKDPRTLRLLRDLAMQLRIRSQTLIILSPILNLPPELEKEVTVIDFGLPSKEDIETMLGKVIASVQGVPGVDVNLSEIQRESLVKGAQGLTLDEIESVFARSLVENRRLDVESILQEKRQLIRKSGILEYYPAQEGLETVGGMELLKKWLSDRQESFTDKA